VGAEFGFAGEPEAGWLGAAPALETKARIANKPIRITRRIGGEVIVLLKELGDGVKEIAQVRGKIGRR